MSAQQCLKCTNAVESLCLSCLLEDAGAQEIIEQAADAIVMESRANYGWPNIHPSQQRRHDQDIDLANKLLGLLPVKDGGTT